MLRTHDDPLGTKNGSNGHSCGRSAAASMVTEPVRADLPPSVDLGRIERAVREILLAVGENPERDGLLDTPKRVAKAYRDLFAGLREDAGDHLSRVFEQRCDDAVIVRDIDLFSLCEHHLLPFMGSVHIAYIPDGDRVVGLSKLARTVDVFAKRPQLQERLTNQIADAIEEHLSPRGVSVVVRAEHMCMKMRGAQKTGSEMVTVAHRGMLRDAGDVRAEVMSLLVNPIR